MYFHPLVSEVCVFVMYSTPSSSNSAEPLFLSPILFKFVSDMFLKFSSGFAGCDNIFPVSSTRITYPLFPIFNFDNMSVSPFRGTSIDCAPTILPSSPLTAVTIPTLTASAAAQ